MTSSARELLKWLAVILMTGDHVAKVICGGYVPGLSEAGRVAFPLFALVMAYNLAQPGADVIKSVRRLALWGVIAQPVHALTFGYWLPLNILLTFALCAAAVYAAGQRNWIVLAFAAAVLPAFVDYQWAGVGFVLLAWLGFRTGRPLLTLAVLRLLRGPPCVHRAAGAYTAAMSLRRYFDIHYWVARWMDRAFARERSRKV